MLRTEGTKDRSARRVMLAAALAVAAIVAGASLVSTASAKQKNKKNQPTTGRIEVSTNPGGYPITIDGQPAGETTDYVRAIELPRSACPSPPRRGTVSWTRGTRRRSSRPR